MDGVGGTSAGAEYNLQELSWSRRNPKNFQFFQQEVEFAGFKTSTGKISRSPLMV